jgi:hypothetical protein
MKGNKIGEKVGKGKWEKQKKKRKETENTRRKKLKLKSNETYFFSLGVHLSVHTFFSHAIRFFNHPTRR